MKLLDCHAGVCGDGGMKSRELVVWGVGLRDPIPTCVGMTKKMKLLDCHAIARNDKWDEGARIDGVGCFGF